MSWVLTLFGITMVMLFSPAQENQSPCRVLYVEDDDSIRSVTELILQRLGGCTVYACSSGMDAVRLAEDGFHADLILIDVMMPELDELLALKDVKGVIEKPFEPRTLMTQINSFLETSAL